MTDMTLGEAAKAIGVSVDTLRRWDRAGQLRTTRDARRAQPPARPRHETAFTHSTSRTSSPPAPAARSSAAPPSRPMILAT
ncbi:MAG: MerR family DNA-binding transcriptional regulator [Solirubrobacteraceae bacterium]